MKLGRREILVGSLAVVAEGTLLPEVAIAAETEVPIGSALTGRVFRWTDHGWSWGGKAKQDLRRVGMRIWVTQPGINEATELPYLPDETGTFLASSIRFHSGPKLGGVVHIPVVYDRGVAALYLARMERVMEKSLMLYNLLGTVDAEGREAMIAERYPGDAWVKACEQWRRDNEWA